MAVDKFSISLPEQLVVGMDELAGREGVTRSAVIREAVTRYLSERESEAAEAARRERVGDALTGFDEIAAEWGADERSGLDYLREIRGDAVPLGDQAAAHIPLVTEDE